MSLVICLSLLFLMESYIYCFKQFQSIIDSRNQAMSKNKQGQSQKVQKVAKQTELKNEPKRQSQIEKYMKQLTSKTVSFTKVLKEAQKGEKSIIKSINKGKLQIKQKPSDLKNLLIQQKIDDQQQKAKLLKKRRQQILEAIQKLDMRNQKSNQSYKSIGKQYNNPQLLKYKPDSILSKEEHEAFVQKIRKEQQAQDQKSQQRLYRLQKKLKQQEQNQKRAQEQKLNMQKQLRKQQSQYKLSLREEMINLKNIQQQRSQKQLSQLKKKSPLYKLLQQKYNNEVVIPGLEQKKRKLKQMRDFNKSYKVQEVKEHEKKYMTQRNKSMQISHSQSKVKLGPQWIYKKPEMPEKFKKHLQQQITNIKKQLERDQRQIQQKILRQDNYIRLLKQKHLPKTDQNLQKQIESRIERIHTKRRQIKIQPNQIGKEYLVKAKQMKKYQSEEQLPKMNGDQIPKLQSSRINYLKHNDDKQYYLGKRQQNIQKIMNSDKARGQKQMQLKQQSQKVEQAYRRNQQILKIKNGNFQARNDAATLLLSGIQAKIGLIKLAN